MDIVAVLLSGWAADAEARAALRPVFEAAVPDQRALIALGDIDAWLRDGRIAQGWWLRAAAGPDRLSPPWGPGAPRRPTCGVRARTTPGRCWSRPTPRASGAPPSPSGGSWRRAGTTTPRPACSAVPAATKAGCGWPGS